MVPLSVGPIEGVPDEFLALIGSPLPDFDSTIATTDEGTADPEDVQRWLNEWTAWQAWMSANHPNVTPEIAAMGYVPDSINYDAVLRTDLENSSRLVLNEPLGLEYTNDTSAIGTGYRDGRSLVVNSRPAVIHSYTVIDGKLDHEEGPHTHRPLLALRLLGQESENGETIWRVHMIEFPRETS